MWGACGTDFRSPPGIGPDADPFGLGPTCSSGSYASNSGDGSSTMDPGGACIGCHQNTGGEAPLFTAAGTIYPTAHEPTNCNGATGAQVQITDANQTVITVNVNSAGNFSTRAPLVFPITAAVVDGARVRIMQTPQTTGDCNSCHTEQGANGAPGRIVMP